MRYVNRLTRKIVELPIATTRTKKAPSRVRVWIIGTAVVFLGFLIGVSIPLPWQRDTEGFQVTVQCFDGSRIVRSAASLEAALRIDCEK